MKNILFYSLALLFIVACSDESDFLDNSVNTKAPCPPLDLKIVTQNVGWLPSNPISGSFRGESVSMINHLRSKHANADVIVLQEAFSPDKYFTLINLMAQSGFIHHTDNGRGEHGIWIFSKHQIQLRTSRFFNSCNGTTSCSSDCLTNKGFLWTSINVAGNTVYILGTHLDANDCVGDVCARRDQMEEIDSWIQNFSILNPDNPFFIVGDLNIDCKRIKEGINFAFEDSDLVLVSGFPPRDFCEFPRFFGYGFTNYHLLREKLNSWSVFEDDKDDMTSRYSWLATVPDGKLLDYILMRNDFCLLYTSDAADE